MNLTELSDLLSSATDVLRVETLDAYSSPSDVDYLERFRRGEPKPDPSEKQPWLDRLASVSLSGHPWRWLRVVPRPVTEYIRYSAEFGYVDNVDAGLDLRVLDEATQGAGRIGPLRRIGDLWLLDGLPVFADYTREGAFMDATWGMPDQAESIKLIVDLAWRAAEPFTPWWSRNVDLHRDLATA